MNKVLKYILVSLAIFAYADVYADGVKKVEGTYTYYGDKNDSPASARRKALEGARIDAISKKFGTIVTQDVLQADRIGANGEDTKFFSLSATELKGEWIADDGEPVYEQALDADGNFVVTCKVKGTAKEISNESVEFEALALRNGKTKGNATTEYHEGDDLYVSFTAPMDGYVAMFLMLEDGKVLKLLPYISSGRQEARVNKNYDYVFFDDQRAAGDFGTIDSFQIATNGEIEFNKLYVLFSPTAFSMPMTKIVNDIPTLGEEDFHKWLVRTRRNDAKMGVKQINLRLMPN